MLKSYLVLGLPLNAPDQEIRKRYLQLVKEYTPEKDPVQFQKITTAYESIKDKRKRIKTDLFNALQDMETSDAIKTLAASVRFTRKTPGLKELLKAIQD